MASLYGIETETDCREKLDELLELHQRAEQTPNKANVAALKSSLEAYFKKGNSQRGEARMSPIEQRYFWPAVREAFVRAPRLSAPATWSSGLYDVGFSLKYYRPRE